MKMDLQALPKLRDSISYIYLEHAIIEQEDSSIVAIRKDGRMGLPHARGDEPYVLNNHQ